MKKGLLVGLLCTCLFTAILGNVANAKADVKQKQTVVTKMYRYSSDPGETDVVV